MLTAEVPIAEPTVSDDGLDLLRALLGGVLFEVAERFLATAEREREVDGGVARDGVVGEGGCGGGEVLAGVHEAHGCAGEVGADSEEGAEGGYGR